LLTMPCTVHEEIGCEALVIALVLVSDWLGLHLFHFGRVTAVVYS